MPLEGTSTNILEINAGEELRKGGTDPSPNGNGGLRLHAAEETAEPVTAQADAFDAIQTITRFLRGDGLVTFPAAKRAQAVLYQCISEREAENTRERARLRAAHQLAKHR